MNSQQMSNKVETKNFIEKFLKHWKYIALSLIICLSIAVLYLRYATYKYEAVASIKLKDDSNNENLNRLTDMQNYGLFNQNTSVIDDEIEILKSRLLVEKIIKQLKLNIQFYKKGSVTSFEMYKSPPLNINFLENDSVIEKVTANFSLKILSETNFEFTAFNETLENKQFAFGDNIDTPFGHIIITPNFKETDINSGDIITVKIFNTDFLSEIYQQKINVARSGTESNIIKLSIQDPIKKKAEDILNTLIHNYNDYVTKNQEQVVKVTSDFINNRLEMVSAELSQVDLTAETIKKDNRLTELSSQSSLFLESEQQNKARINETTNQLQLVDYISNYLNENSDTGDLMPSNIGITDNSYIELTNRHNELVLTRNRILENSTLKNPTVVNLDEQINNIKQSLSNSLNNIKQSNQIILGSLSKEDARLSSKIYSAPRKERQFRDIQRQQQIKESIFLYLLERREESAISLGVSRPNAEVIDYAKAFSDPVFPSRKIVVLAASFIGMIIPLLIIYVHDFLDTKIHTPQDLKRFTDIPFLGDIPKSKTKHSIIKRVDYSPKAEAFRIIRTNIDFMLSNIPKNQGKVIFVTSTTSQEGKSHTSINLSKSLSFSNKKVLLVETDIRVPKANKYLNIESKIGLTDYLVSNKIDLKQVMTKVDDNLFVISSGTIPPNPAELLMSEKMETLFETVKKEYDYIVVDTAAVGLVTDTLIISHYADIVVYVVRANYLDRRQLSTAETMYSEKRLPNMSLLLNGVKSKKGYGYGYGNKPKDKKSTRK